MADRTGKHSGTEGRDEKTVLVARINAAHGIKGLVKLQSFTEKPEAFLSYAPLMDESGHELKLSVQGESSGLFIARISGIEDRTAAEKLKGHGVYAYKEKLVSADSDEFLAGDLAGMEVADAGGKSYGKVSRVVNYGSCDLLEVQSGTGKSFLVPFTPHHVNAVDFAAGRVEVADVQQLLDLGGIRP